MAGKDHHHVWRMLQRGFGEKRGKDHHIWVYRKGAKPIAKGTGNFGVDKYFYGPEGSETDTIITNFENSVQGEIQNVRKMEDGEELSGAFVAPLVAHLEIRSHFLRSELSSMFERLLAAIDEHFSSPKKIQALLKHYLQNNRKEVDAFLARNLVPTDRRGEALNLLDAYIDNLLPSAAVGFFNGKLSEIFRLAKLVPDGIKEAHNKSIIEIKPDSPRIRALETYAYSVYRPRDGQLILPDTCMAFAGSKNVAPVSQFKDDMKLVIIPISSEVAICGCKGKQRPTELKTINRLLAGCAYDAFIAKSNDQRLVPLTGRIGKYAKLMSDKDIRELFEFEKLLSRQKFD
ncbi:hypothetical protein BV509_20510 [Rhodovulum sulfidophilum]|uniref:DUF4238 domain-containing protein n=1 Tax=Rhodovulum visakhapatnamense TaxID=364297 RepID=A0ABS1RLK3_9RHOB|nr:DUF4238 domain-containing protein [Rhodovulum visakhapatnamense]MBL3571924.1 DUF4238 domain-containing protein [Rhodovulum visakhapatnamense]MBL3580513.1 DUF4238 domain-containing protein [Rhodovulum visakhapatnamense]OLS46499.1 hypothetical protein BV509_20510 [Rhodovulum sulfidophilum]